MPQATVEEWSSELLPEDTLFTGRLMKVWESTKPYTDKNSGEKKEFKKWEWTFEITDGDYETKKAYGETMARVTNHPDNQPRLWGEVLIGRAIEPGMSVNTDDWVGLSCRFEVSHEHYTKNGEDRAVAKVTALYPLAGAEFANSSQAAFSDEPPF
jgi:hypothetical protein